MTLPLTCWLYLTIFLLVLCISTNGSISMNSIEKERLKLKTLEMFDHAYGAYKKYAYPADELMPLSCKGRYRGSEKDRGDIDEALGNFSLTLIDTLDTLVVLGKLDEFDKQVHYVIRNVSFNSDAVVSVFETNIRVLGGLLGAHSVAIDLKKNAKGMLWYKDELLTKALDIADRLLPAFNTTTGIPYPKVNLRYGINNPKSRVGHERDTCTACAGTMIMEFGALSRLTGIPIYEEKAHKAMDALWRYRSRHSDLVGTTINIHNGEWTRRDSGIGAGIDSYYEYCLKAYILLGDDSYLAKFNKHYAAINKYVKQGYMLIDVLMHQPDRRVRNSVDSLQAFWPGLQVLKGDLKPAIETHEMLYKVAKKYKFLPESFNVNLEMHWTQHPLRPEFVESTYFLYQATKDPYYLDVGKHVLDSLEEHARVPCGFAAFHDLRTYSQEDKMDSFVLAETFKYLYLLFSEEVEHPINIHDYIFTTEAHLLPLYLSMSASPTKDNTTSNPPIMTLTLEEHSSCRNERNTHHDLRSFAEMVRHQVNSAGKIVKPSCQSTSSTSQTSEQATEQLLKSLKVSFNRPRKLKAEEFIMGNEVHLNILKDLGITLQKESNGKVQLVHQAALAKSTEDAEEGILFMQEMIQLAKQRNDNQEFQPRVVTLLSPPHDGKVQLAAGSAQFGADLGHNQLGVSADAVETVPFRACQTIENGNEIVNRIAVIERGDCMFIDKVRLAQRHGALGVIIVDHTIGTAAETSQPFGMSGDSNPGDVHLPSVFLFRREGDILRNYMHVASGVYLEVQIAARNGEKDKETTKSSEQSNTHGNRIPGKQEVHIDSQGRKITVTTNEYIRPNSAGVMKKFIEVTTEECPSVLCDHDVNINVRVSETVLEESIQMELDQSSEEKLDRTRKGTNVNKPVDPSKGTIGSFKQKEEEKGEKEEVDQKKSTKICTATGCFDSFDELKSMNQMAKDLLSELTKIKDKLEVPMDSSADYLRGVLTQTENRMKESIDLIDMRKVDESEQATENGVDSSWTKEKKIKENGINEQNNDRSDRAKTEL